MKKLEDIATLTAGNPQTRVDESLDEEAPLYFYYSQEDLLEDLYGKKREISVRKKIHTHDALTVVKEGDVIFNLLSGRATWGGKEREQYFYTQNYIKILPQEGIFPDYLVYLLNEDLDIKKQLSVFVQGSHILKYSIAQIRGLEIRNLPSFEEQKKIASVYRKQLHREYLKKKVAELETSTVLYQVRR